MTTASRDHAVLLPGFWWPPHPSMPVDQPIPVTDVHVTSSLTRPTAASFTMPTPPGVDPTEWPSRSWVGVTVGGPVPPVPAVTVTTAPPSTSTTFADVFTVTAEDPDLAAVLIDPAAETWLQARVRAGDPATFTVTSNWVLCPADEHPSRDAAVAFLTDLMSHLRFDRAVEGRTVTEWEPDDPAPIVLDRQFPAPDGITVRHETAPASPGEPWNRWHVLGALGLVAAVTVIVYLLT